MKKNYFAFESHETQTTDELPEQGVVETVADDATKLEITAPADVVEAGDDIAQGTPNEVIEADTVETPEGDVVDTSAEVSDSVVEEITSLTEAGVSASAASAEIVEQATALDVNGNTITPEQAEENAEEAEVDEEVDAEAEEAADAKDLDGQVAEIEENASEELGETLVDTTEGDGSVDESATDDTSTDIDTDSDQGDLGMDPEDDDTPLEGAEPDASPDDSTGSDDVPDTDVVEEAVVDTETPAENTEVVSDDTSADTQGDLEDTNVEPVEETVDEQNEAADVTAQAASADVDQTEFIADQEPEQHGELPAVDELPETTDATDELPANDGEVVVAEAEPASQVEVDVSTGQQPVPEEEDDTPLEGAEPLTVEETQSLTPTEVDGDDAQGATVEESVTDQEAVELDAVNEDVVVEEEPVEIDEEVVEEPVPTGEIEETDEPAELEEGELDIPDIDTETTEEEVEEATAEADEIEAEADAEEAEGDVADKTIEELQKEAEALEEFRQILEHSITTENYSPQLVAYINAKIDPLRNTINGLFGSDPIKAVSLESFDVKDLDLAYTASLESVRGMISRVSTITHALTQKVEQWWSKGLVTKVTKRTSAVNKELDLQLVRLKDSGWTTGEIKGIGAYLSHAEGNLVKAVSDDLKLITDVSGKGFKASETLQGYLVKALNDIIQAATGAEATKVSNAVADFKNTKSAFPDAAFSKGFLGGYKLELKDAVKGDALKDRILSVGRTAIPVVIKDGKGGSTSANLTKGDIANLLKLAKAYVAIAEKLAKTTGERAAENVGKIRLTRERALPVVVEGRIRSNDEVAVDAVATSLTFVTQAHNDLYKFVTKHCIDTAEALNGIAKKAIK